MLSVIMITIPERDLSFRKLHLKLRQQLKYCNQVHPSLGDVEIVRVVTPKFPEGPSIGEKRQMGLEQSKGEYVCWLDDDDDISPDYLEIMLRLAYTEPDVLTFSNLSRFDSFWCVVRMSLDTKEDEQVKPGIINRRPYHVCGWRKSIALKAGFPATNWDEDTGFVSRALPLCTSESHAENIIHEYKRLTKSYAVEALRS
jgi:glycosyltransferase involved in cell wall biosynthesis